MQNGIFCKSFLSKLPYIKKCYPWVNASYDRIKAWKRIIVDANEEWVISLSYQIILIVIYEYVLTKKLPYKDLNLRFE